MKKVITLILAVALTAPAMLAQISEGQPTAKTIRTGNRPQKGTFGMYYGVTSDIFDAYYNGMDAIPLPIINFKHMSSDNFEFRLGLDPFATTNKFNGKASEDKIKDSHGESHIYLYPGFAYHFSPKNILDVYLGAEFPVGYATSKEYSSAGKIWNKETTGSFRLGAGAFVGFQCFIADLPLALGLEYGISANCYLGGQIKRTYYDGTKKTVKYDHPDGTYADMTKLSLYEGALGNQIRLTLSYYFK